MTLKTWKTLKAQPQCCGKRTFATQLQALGALDRKRRIGYAADIPSGVYRCKRGKWHLKDRSEPTSGGVTEWEHVKAGVLKRDGHRCISCGSAKNLDAHHRKLQSQGGRDVPQGLVTLCRTCHDRAHDHPLEAAKAGLIVRSGSDPLAVPVVHREWDEPIYLTADYQYGLGGS